MKRKGEHLVRGHSKMNCLKGGVLLMIFAALLGCTGGPPQNEPGQTPRVNTPKLSPTPTPKPQVSTPTPLPSPTALPQQPTPQGLTLRSKPLRVSEDKMSSVFVVDNTNWRPFKYVKHDFQNRGNFVLDQATGLMWQKSGSNEPMLYNQAQAYITQLNQARFAGYADWRLPTMPELLTLVEPQPQATEWYLNLLFDKKQVWCWSADTLSATEAWAVNFQRGSVNWLTLTNCYVRAVRSK